MRYQLVVLGPESGTQFAALRDEFFSQISAIGLDPQKDVEILTPAKLEEVRFDASPVCVWFGGTGAVDAAHNTILDHFLSEGQPVLPAWSVVGSYHVQVPPSLHRIEGCDWRADHPEDVPRLVADVLRSFRLARVQRQCFISYRRAETRRVALQLISELAARGYRTFLDTASVPGGVDFQASLWGQLADVDMLVFLDSPNALDSTWVQQELARAHDLGMGVLQLIWPGASRTVGTELSDPHQLQDADLSPAPPPVASSNYEPTLVDSALQQVLAAVERTRIRSLHSRRVAVVGELLDRARDFGLTPVAQPVGPVFLYKSDDDGAPVVGEVVPLVGLPDALVLQAQERDRLKTTSASGGPPDWDRHRVTYLGLGMPSEWADHLQWLNDRRTVQAMPVDLLGPWLKEL